MVITRIKPVQKFNAEFSKAMDTNGITQYSLSKALGHDSNGFVHLVREGKRDIPIDELSIWLDQLGLQPAEWSKLYMLAIRESAPKVMQDLMKEVDAQKGKVRAILEFAQALTGVDFDNRHLPSEQRKIDLFIRKNNPMAASDDIVQTMRDRLVKSLDAVLDPKHRAKPQ